jgi:HNH endonuclease
MKCIFCLEEKDPSDEHIIPDSIGGTIRMKEVCRHCNSKLSSLVDNPFASCSLIQLARYNHSLGGKRGVVPFPMGRVGTLQTGQKVTLNENFEPHVKRVLEIQKDEAGNLSVHFSMDTTDVDKLDQMLAEPLRKLLRKEFPAWSEEKLEREVERIVAAARTQPPVSDKSPIKQQWQVGLNDLLFEFFKIAYEMWFLKFGYPWVENSPTAKLIRDAILNRNPGLAIRGKLFCDEPSLPISDPAKNHLILRMTGSCFMRIFNISCLVECEAAHNQFKLKSEDSLITIQDFSTGKVIEEKLCEFVAKNLGAR